MTSPTATAEIERLANAATDGPWEAILQDDPRGNCSPMYTGLVALIEAGEGGISVVAEHGHVAKEDWPANAAFIAASRQAIPDLLAALRAAEADAARYHFLRDHCGGHTGMTCEQPAEWSISWEFQQGRPAERFGTFDKWIDADIKRHQEFEEYADREANEADEADALAAIQSTSAKEGES